MEKQELTTEKQAELEDLAEAIWQIENAWFEIDGADHPDIAEAAQIIDQVRCELIEVAEAIAGEEIDVETVTGRYQPTEAAN